MSTENSQNDKVVRFMPPSQTVFAVAVLAASGSLLLLSMFFTNLKEYDFIGKDLNTQATITVTGDGEAYATPDIATVSFSITQEAKSIAEARKVVDAKMKTIHDYLNKQGVDNKDIKANYAFYPKYNNVRQPCPLNVVSGSVVAPCYDYGKQVLTGYEVTESVDVTIRAIDKDPDLAGTIVGGLADNGATNLSGPNFSLENSDAKQAEAREAAIAKAKTKADKLASDLGVSIVRIASFNEGNNFPIMYGMTAKAMSADSGAAPEAANIPAGQNKYTSSVTIVYEIK